jgi:hypothetical protein
MTQREEDDITQAQADIIPERRDARVCYGTDRLVKVMTGSTVTDRFSFEARVGTQTWPTSLLPMGDGRHFIALPAKVRAKQKIGVGDAVSVFFEVRSCNV